MTTTENVKVKEIHPDVLKVAQQLTNEVKKLVAGVETLDANNWLKHADKIDALNEQLQNMLLPPEPPPVESTKA